MSSTVVPAASGVLCLILLVHSTSIPAKSAQAVQHVATLKTARAAHTATTLQSGHVLVTGGMDGGGSLSSVELFDPANNTVQEIGNLAARRSGHTATLLDDGRALIAGGYSGEYLASIEVFDPSTKRFHPAGSLEQARSGHTATLLTGGRILFVGGVGKEWTFLRSAELYDPNTGRSEAVGSMAVARESHTATLLSDGRVLIIGGHTGRRPNQVLQAGAEVFSLQNRRFETAGSLLTARHKHDAVRLTDGRVLVIGGADRSDRNHYATTETYNPATATFERGPSMTHRRYKIAGTSVLLSDGDVLVTAGAPVAELLDVKNWIFREVPGRLPAAYRFAAAAPLRDGDVFVTGGYSDSNQNTAGIWRFRRP
jgi:hypothetical protein